MTPNDEVNSLAVREFIELFGLAEACQLPHKPAAIESLERPTPHLPGRMLFDKSEAFNRLAGTPEVGATLKVTGMTAEFDYDAFLRHYGKSAVVLMLIDQNCRLSIVTSDTELSPQRGQKLVSLAAVSPEDLGEPIQQQKS